MTKKLGRKKEYEDRSHQVHYFYSDKQHQEMLDMMKKCSIQDRTKLLHHAFAFFRDNYSAEKQKIKQLKKIPRDEIDAFIKIVTSLMRIGEFYKKNGNNIILSDTIQLGIEIGKLSYRDLDPVTERLVISNILNEIDNKCNDEMLIRHDGLKYYYGKMNDYVKELDNR